MSYYNENKRYYDDYYGYEYNEDDELEGLIYNENEDEDEDEDEDDDRVDLIPMPFFIDKFLGDI